MGQVCVIIVGLGAFPRLHSSSGPEKLDDPIVTTPLFHNEYFTVLCHPHPPVVEVVRSNVAFPSPQGVGTAFAPMLLLLDSLGRHRYVLLLDSREAVPNNDPEYEASYARYRTDLHRGFRRIAVLVKTPVGNLQATRLLPHVEAPIRVFQDRDVAWNFLTAGQSLRPSQGSDDAPVSRRDLRRE